MKKTLLATLLIGVMGTAMVSAATDNAAVTQKVDQMKSEFNLDDQQANRISNILSRATMTDADKAAKRTARMEQRMERRLARMKENLGLSDEQVTQIKTLMTQQHEQMRAMREQGKANLTAVLTPEQAAKFSEMGNKGKGWGRGHRGGGHHGKGMRGGKRGGMCDK